MHNEHVLYTDKEVTNTNDLSRLSGLARNLLQQQLQAWPLAAKNYQGLEQVQVRSLSFNEYSMNVQFNPERIRSSAAKVDKKSIENRRCFLCSEHLPPEQKGILFEEQYLVLVNPFPIFNEHFTIPHLEHKPQRIKGEIQSMLHLARAMNDYIVFYNGPKCGASAPDHMHFQAGRKGLMPIDNEYAHMKQYFDFIHATPDIKVYGMPKYGRHFIALEGNHEQALLKAFNVVYNRLAEWPHEEEPMLNMLAGYWNDHWRIQIFPRKAHRPWQYFAEGNQQVMLSPASVDFGGTLITPRQEDFEKMTPALAADIMQQVTITDQAYRDLRDYLKDLLPQSL